MSATRQMYHEDMHVYTGDAVVVDARDATPEEATKHSATHALVLDRTLFYPQGGGQPADTGSVTCGARTFAVRHVSFSPETGVITHFGVFEGAGGTFSLGDNVCMAVDAEKRTLHTRLHSAGHVFDLLLQRAEPLVLPTHARTGYHFPAGPYVDYSVPEGLDVSPASMTALRTRLEAEIAALASSGGVGVETASMTANEAMAFLGKDMLSPKALAAPTVRVVRFTGQGTVGASACAGTHVRHTSELGSIIIRRLTAKAGVLRVAYALA